ncbi:MAG: cytochrome-c peroxidase, partial [Gammaproteobacteria bacterium]|nr:cytochrome-c peroxidase [Gammaproteobacteria bacterium]
MQIYLIQKPIAHCVATCILSICGIASAAPETDGLATIGQALFFDTNLSANRTQACGTCHEPGHAFSDGRENDVSGAVSLGDDGETFGDRNTPATTYAFLIPEFHQNAKGEYVGGYFLDGRAATMAEQAAEPFINPLEMALPDHQALVNRVRENVFYEESLKKYFGEDVFENTETALDAITASIVAFERSDTFAPFDSKYDRFLRGEYELTDEEELGR